MASIDNLNNPSKLDQNQSPGSPVTQPVNPPINPKTVPQFVPPVSEEFKYQPKKKFNFKGPSKIVASILILLLLVVPLIFLFLKYYPQFIKKPGTSGEVVWWSLGMDENVLNQMINEYTAINPKAKIKLVVQSNIDYRERLANAIKEGIGPDIFTIHNSWVPMFINDLDVVPENVYSKVDYAKDFYPVIVKDMSTSEGLVGIPLEYDALTLFIDEDIFSFAGKNSEPTTWDEFSRLASDLTINGQKQVLSQAGAAMGLTTNVDYWPEIIAMMMLQNKSSLLSPSGSNALEAINSYAEYYNTKKVWNDTLPNSTKAFSDGKLAMFFAPSRVAFDIQQQNPNLKFKTVVVPQVRKDDPNEQDISYATYWVQVVSKNSSNKTLAWDLLKYLSSRDPLTKMYNLAKEAGVRKMIYPRIDMRDQLINDRIYGSVVALAPSATSWYLADKTNDGDKGINTLADQAYKKIVDQASKSKGARDPLSFFKPLIADLRLNLSPFNITR